MGGRLRQFSCAPIQQTNPPPLKQNLDKKTSHNKLAARVHAPPRPFQTLADSALIRRFHNGVCERRAYPMRGGGLHAFHVWHVLLIACCDCCLVAAALVLTNTELQNLKCPTTGAKSLACIANQCLGRNGM